MIYINEIQISHSNGECMLLIEDPEKNSTDDFRKKRDQPILLAELQE